MKTYPFDRFFKYNDITNEKLEYLKNKGYNIDNINEENSSKWLIRYDLITPEDIKNDIE